MLEVHEIDNILRYFDPEKKGSSKSYDLDEVLTEGYHRTLDAVIEVNASKVFKFKGNLNVDIERRRTIRIKKTIIFP